MNNSQDIYQARAKLREMIPAKFYICTGLDILDHSDGQEQVSCKISTGCTSVIFTSNTFEECFSQLEGHLKQRNRS